MVHYRNHDHEGAIELYQQAIDEGCRDSASVKWNMSLALHAIGRYKEGWVAHEFREHQRNNPALWLPMRRFVRNRWTGEPPIKEDGSQVLIHVHSEAGSGDNLCMIRYLRVLAEQGYKVRYECAPDMVDLVRYSMPEIEVVPKAVDYPGALGIHDFDYHSPIGSLPAVMGTDIDSVPWPGPYLCADPELVDRFKAIIDTAADYSKPKVGICWSSGIREGIWMTEYGKRKSMHFDTAFQIIIAMNGRGLAISLQVGPERSQMADYHDGWIRDFLPKKPTWAETAAMIANLDLVITVDTAVAHLAGAMGKPVWLMCQRDGCSWHFMCWRPNATWNEASPWYPSARIFRPKTYQPHFWDDVVAEIAKELGQWSQKIAAE